MSNDELVLYHNPRCSKSREALELLTAHGAVPRVVEYLDRPPSRADLERLLAALDQEPSALVRRDARFKELTIDPSTLAAKADVLAVLLEHPELLQRPVVLRGVEARIGRPPERVLELVDDPGSGHPTLRSKRRSA